MVLPIKPSALLALEWRVLRRTLEQKLSGSRLASGDNNASATTNVPEKCRCLWYNVLFFIGLCRVTQVTRVLVLDSKLESSNYGRTLSERPCYILPMFFFSSFFMAALVGQTAERIFTKLSHVVDIRCYLRTY